ncbi:hypothetical protein ACFQJ5_15805 [Halomicroarcula sp. GCM10025324]|jgi:hypothetical protein|uniref:hypothetical protein n=1 Tax=Haloarcula TaxID=2237 RepID=UPI0023E8C099|nr:hypothetical protein [Halomicroarcula sp. ZS-22-S1]
MLALPLQVIDSFLLRFTIGDFLLLGFVLGAVGILPTRSLRTLGLHTIAIGVILLLTPASAMEPNAGSILASSFQYKLFGLVLLVLAPVLFAVGRR